VCEEGDARRPSDVVLQDTAQPALDGTTRTIDAAAAARSRESTPVRLSRQLRGDLDAIVMQALRREPRHRYGSAELLARDVEQFLDGAPVTAHARGRAYAVGKFVRRHRVSVTAGALAVASLVAGTAISLWQAAEARAQRDIAQSALAESDQVTDFLIDLFESSAPGAVVTDALTARDLVRRGTGRIDELAGQPRVQMRMLVALGRVHEGIGEYEEGQRLTQRGLSLVNALASPASDDVAQLLLQHGILQRRRGRYDSAEVSFMRARGVLADARQRSPQVLGQVMNQLASIAIYRGDLLEAERRARAALDVQVAELGETHRLSVNALTYLGAVQWRRGSPEAEESFRRAIELRPQAAGSTRGEAMLDRLQLTDLLLTEERSLAEVEAIVREVIASMRPDVPEEFGAAIWSRGNLVALLELRGEAEAGLALRREVLDLHRNVYGPDHRFTGQDLSGLGRALVRLGRPGEAERLFDEAAVILTKTFGTRHPGYAAVLHDRAMLLAARGDPMAADSLIDRALQLQPVRTSGPYAELLRYRATLRVQMRDHATAEALLHEALDLVRTNASERTDRVRTVHASLADLYAATGLDARSSSTVRRLNSQSREQADRRLGHEHAPEHAGLLPVERHGEVPAQRDLEQPEEDEVDLRRRHRVACAVECLHRNHPPAVDEERVRQDAQPLGADGDDARRHP
jgi:eukaryotic-like serine/threonine-protein kinase